MTDPVDGRKIKAVFWPDTETEQGQTLSSPENGDIVYVVENRGDHGLDWIVHSVDGKEVARHNPRYVETIVWLEEDEDARHD